MADQADAVDALVMGLTLAGKKPGAGWEPQAARPHPGRKSPAPGDVSPARGRNS